MMRNLKIGVYLLALFGMVGCSNMSIFDSANAKSSNEDIAELTDYELKDGFITIHAVGYGCTFFDSFKVEAAENGENALEVVRLQPDQCGMKPRSVSLQYSYKHLGLDLNRNVEVKNPVSLATTNETVIK